MLQADERSDAKQTCSTTRIALAETVCIHCVVDHELRGSLGVYERDFHESFESSNTPPCNYMLSTEPACVRSSA